MEHLWYTLILAGLLVLYYFLKKSTWDTNQLDTDIRIMKKFKDSKDEKLVEILQKSGIDKFKIKNVNVLTRKERKEYLKKIEEKFEEIKKYFKSQCAKMLIDQREEDIEFLMKVEKDCNPTCKNCEHRSLKRRLTY